MRTTRRDFLASSLALAAPAAAAEPLIVKAKRKPADAWTEYPTRTIRHLPGFSSGGAAPATGSFGGRKDRKWTAPGFFRVRQDGGRWWLVDPEGYAFLKVGVCSTSPGRSKTNRAALADKFGSEEKWTEATVKLLRQNHFNGIGGWSSVDLFRAVKDRLVYTPSWSFAAGFGREKKLTFQQPGHVGFAGDTIPVFHPEFEEWCDRYAQRIAEYKDDPWLLGHYSDNELPAYPDILDRALKLDASNPAAAPTLQMAKQWLTARKAAPAGLSDVNDADREAFVEVLFERYFRVTTAAIRKYDPNHLCLGPRLHGGSFKHPGTLRVAGKYLDAVAVNVYWRWTPEPELYEAWRTHLKKPVIITEFYAKGADSGFPNTTGAGWLVPTQKDRAYYYQNFLLSMLESRMCVGWDWFKYMDNDPEDLTTDPSNRDSNKGMVTIRYEPYKDLIDGMREFNREVYRLADYFDRG
jgi:hypothetical protein